jgi:hypothetical protein
MQQGSAAGKSIPMRSGPETYAVLRNDKRQRGQSHLPLEPVKARLKSLSKTGKKKMEQGRALTTEMGW